MKSILICLAALSFPLLSQADTIIYQTSYTFDANFALPVTNLLAQEVPGTCCGARLNYEDPDSGIAAASTVTILDNPFANVGGPANTTSFIMGVVQDPPTGEVAGAKHLVMFMNPAASLLANGRDFAALFPAEDEGTLIANLQLATSGGDSWGNSFEVLAPGLSSSVDFMSSLASPGGFLNSDNTTFTSPYFALPAPGASASDFVAVEFSTGQIIGTGSVVQTDFIIVDAAPEPSTFLLFSLFFVAGAFLIRRSQAASLT